MNHGGLYLGRLFWSGPETFKSAGGRGGRGVVGGVANLERGAVIYKR